MNVIVSAVVGLALGAAVLIGGVHAYQGDPQSVRPDQLYSYGDE